MARLIQSKVGEESYLFIHAAKTGGTFFREAVCMAGLKNIEISPKHATLNTTVELYAQRPVPWVSAFGFVRNPISWYQSRWAYGMMTHFGEKILYQESAKNHWMAPVWSDNLNYFIEQSLEKYPEGKATEYFGDMFYAEGHPTVIFRYESLVEDTYKLLKHSFGVDDIKPKSLQTMPRFLDSSSALGRQKVSVSMAHEIARVEHKLMEKYY